MTTKPGTMGMSTIAVHAGATHASPGDAVAPSLNQSVSFVMETGTTDQMYTRYGNTPNAEIVQKRLALLEGAEAALVLSSGMGATTCAMLALLRPGDHLVSSSWIYGGTHTLFSRELTAMGIEVTFVDPLAPRSWRQALKKNTRAIFLESPVNPTCRVLELSALQMIARSEGIALVMDSTLASPVNLRPIEHGVDVVIHSATKYLNGHHDILAGAVMGSAEFVDEVKQKMIVFGQAPDPFACWLLERGLKTIEVRVQRQNENALRLAQWCEGRKEISRVHYPGLSSHPDHAIAKSMMRGFGGMMAIELAAGGDAAEGFIRKLKLFTHASSLGGVDSLISQPRFTSHAKLSTAERAAIGIPDGFMRLSIGIENAEDLIADIEQALPVK
jgi:cystathionine beta-lyase/cystathionine gamma-synthase